MMVRLLRMTALMLALVLGFAVSMVLVYCLPDGPIRSNLRTSAGQLALEGHPYAPMVGLYSLMPDSYTDALMMNQSLRQPGTGPIKAALGNYMRVVESSMPGEQAPIESLEAGIAGKGGRVVSYARYWHGYQVVLRPLLGLLDYRAIRWLNAITLTACLTAVAVILRYRLNLAAAAAFVVAVVAAGIVIVPMSVALSGVFYLALGGMAAVALGMTEHGSLAWDLEAFLVLGALTAFLDLMTVPSLTLGMPLALLVLARMSSASSSAFIRQTVYTARVSLSWVSGYAVTWSAKWVLASPILEYSVLQDAVHSVAYRIGGAEAGAPVSRLDVLIHNVAMYFPLFGWNQSVGLRWEEVALASAVQLAVPLAAAALVLRHRRTDGTTGRVTGLLPVGLLPLAWYLVVSNHSAVHYWFTYRALALTVFVLVAGVLYTIDPRYLSDLKRGIEARLRRPPTTEP